MVTRRGQVLNLVFHAVAEGNARPDDPWTLDADDFRSALDDLAGRLDVALSFDDGSSSDVEIALPALLERSLRASFFITTGWIGRPGYLAEGDIQMLVESGMRVGSHGTTHTRWTELERSALDQELEESRARLEEITGGRISDAACPNGAYDRKVIAAVRAAGYAALYTTDEGLASRTAWLQRRTLVYPAMVGPGGFQSPGQPSAKRVIRQWLSRWL
jgi:peptidoglycan/xylan/chitin deacetylase (PgdA/CDA1 family)